MTSDILTLIPARMAASRLPGKPLAEIAGKPMICHVWEKAMAADLGPVVVATDSAEIMAAIKGAGGRAVLTAADHPSGSDRIYEALCHIDEAGKYNAVINLQGDLPELDPQLLHHLARLLDNPVWDLTTLVAPATAEEAAKPQIVKAVVSFSNRAQTSGKALYFSRAAVPDDARGRGPFQLAGGEVRHGAGAPLALLAGVVALVALIFDLVDRRHCVEIFKRHHHKAKDKMLWRITSMRRIWKQGGS